MKHIIALLLALLLLTAGALADTMVVVNCDEWVSLRKSPSTSSERLKKVPLYDYVFDCTWAENGFVRCTYQDTTGYILEKYLEPLEANEVETLFDETLPQIGMMIDATHQYGNGRELLLVTGYRSSGAEVWKHTVDIGDITELYSTDAFLGGTADEPRVLVYNAEKGLSCLDPRTGDVIWFLSREETSLGAGLAHAVDADGTLYISGYYGPDPVCIDMDGHVRWQSSVGSDSIYWPYEIRIEGDAVVTRYEMNYDADSGALVRYSKADGHVIDIKAE